MQRIDIGLYLVTSIGLSSFGTGHTLARKNVFINTIVDYINHW